VTIEENFEGVTRLFLDSAPVIYYVERNSRYFAIVDVIFELIFDGSLMAVTSPVTLAECLVPPYRLGQTELQQEFINVIVGGDNIMFEPIVDEDIAIQAAQIRARYNLQLPDAFQVAIAMAAECEALLTNDATFRRVTELRVLVLDDLETGE
jgi:predicted nucleic acid-binding protein